MGLEVPEVFMWRLIMMLLQKYGAMEQVSHQCIAMQYLLELAKQLDVDPRGCISSFFTK